MKFTIPGLGNKPLRRYDGGLVAAHGFADVEHTPLADAGPRDQWRGVPGTPVGKRDSGQKGPSQSGDMADTSGYGRAWWDDNNDIPRMPGAGREEQLTTDRYLQTGPAPGRIRRINDFRIGGLIGPDIQNSIPADGNWGYMPHQQVGKLLQRARPYSRTIADDAWLPAVFAGNPVGQ